MRPRADFKPLGGKLVILKPRSRELLREFYTKRFQSEVLRWSDVWPENPTFEEVRLRFEEQENSSKEWRLWIHTHEGKLIGEISLTDIDAFNRRAELSIVLFDPPYWGQGYGTEATMLFLTDAVKRFNLESVYLFTALENKRAIRSFEKLGFHITERLMLEKDRFVRMELESVALTDG